MLFEKLEYRFKKVPLVSWLVVDIFGIMFILFRGYIVVATGKLYVQPTLDEPLIPQRYFSRYSTKSILGAPRGSRDL